MTDIFRTRLILIYAHFGHVGLKNLAWMKEFDSKKTQ